MAHLRFGILGFQHLHIELVLAALRTDTRVRLVGIAERDPIRRQYWAAQLGVPAYANWQELVGKERVEAVAIVDAYGERATTAVACLEQGVHVICDKPVAITMAELELLGDAVRQGKALFSSLLEKRSWGTYRLVKDIVEAGELGDIVSGIATGPHKLTPAKRPQWMFSRELYGGTIVDLAIHDLDALLWFAGGTPAWVRAVHGQHRWTDCGDLHDSGQVMFRTDRGMTGYVDVNWLTPETAPFHGDYRLLLNGTHGAAAVRYEGRDVLLFSEGGGVQQPAVPPDGNPVLDFADAIRSGRQPDIPAADILRATRLSLLARLSADRGEEISWDAPAC